MANQDPRREVATALADLLSGDGQAARALRLMQALGAGDELAGDPHPAGVELADQLLSAYASGPRTVGVWDPHERDGRTVWVRNPAAPAADFFAPTAEFAAKRSLFPLRLCLLGESAAAGWFFAPELTPARVLARRLELGEGPGRYEVLDLAAINLSPESLLELSVAALQLEPDVLVVYAGNNWTLAPSHLPGASLRDCASAALALRESGVLGLSRRANQLTRYRAQRTLAALSRVSDVSGVPLVIVVPEVNLADWQRVRPVGLLAGDGCVRWHDLHAQALDAQARADFAGVASLARRMIELDAGSCPTSWTLLGRALVRLGDAAQARVAFERAVDARDWQNLPSTPSATSDVKDVLREGAARYGYSIVDLPAIFAEQLAGAAPGQELFVDYCHLSARGMDQAMTAVASAIVDLAESPETAQARRAEAAPIEPCPVQPRTEAVASLLSALYNAHYGSEWDAQTPSLEGLAVRYLEAALERWPEIAEAMVAYLSVRALAPQAQRFSRALLRFHELTAPQGRMLALFDGVDAPVFEALVSALTKSGRETKSLLARTLATHGLAAGGRVDLSMASSRWSVAEWQQRGAAYCRQDTRFMRALWPLSHFCLPLAEPARVRLEVVARLSRAAASEPLPLTLLLNGAERETWTISRRWSRHSVELGEGACAAGLNRLTLRWPRLELDGSAALTTAVERLEQGLPVELHPVFGELEALYASRS